MKPNAKIEFFFDKDQRNPIFFGFLIPKASIKCEIIENSFSSFSVFRSFSESIYPVNNSGGGNPSPLMLLIESIVIPKASKNTKVSKNYFRPFSESK